MTDPTPDSRHDRSNGYEAIAPVFADARTPGGVGTSSVLAWSQTLAAGATILDLGCGTGVPIAKALADAGFAIYGVDASPQMVRRFRENLPASLVACEAIEHSEFFGRTFDAILAWGLMFLLSESTQREQLAKIARALGAGGRLLFTAPRQRCEWHDLLTGQLSRSLGRNAYAQILSANGVPIVREFDDSGGNYYYDAVRTAAD